MLVAKHTRSRCACPPYPSTRRLRRAVTRFSSARSSPASSTRTPCVSSASIQRSNWAKRHRLQVDLHRAIALGIQALDHQPLLRRTCRDHTLQTHRVEAGTRLQIAPLYLRRTALHVGIKSPLLLERGARCLRMALRRLPQGQIEQHQQQEDAQRHQCQAITRRQRLPALRQRRALPVQFAGFRSTLFSTCHSSSYHHACADAFGFTAGRAHLYRQARRFQALTQALQLSEPRRLQLQ